MEVPRTLPAFNNVLKTPGILEEQQQPGRTCRLETEKIFNSRSSAPGICALMGQ